LILASWQGNKEVVKQLLIGGADVLAVAKNGETALSAAVGKGFTEIEDMLRDYGARLPDESRIRFNSGPRGH
jgi:ankyrin repeat protein